MPLSLLAAWSCTAVRALQRCLPSSLPAAVLLQDTHSRAAARFSCAAHPSYVNVLCCAFFCSVLPWSVILF